MSDEPLYRKLPNYANVGRLIRSARVSAGLPLAMDYDDELGVMDNLARLTQGVKVRSDVIRSSARGQSKKLTKSFKRSPDKILLKFNDIIWTAIGFKNDLEINESHMFIGVLPKYSIGTIGLYAMNYDFLEQVYRAANKNPNYVSSHFLKDIMMHVNNAQNILCVERKTGQRTLRYAPGTIAKKIGSRPVIIERLKGNRKLDVVDFEDIPMLVCGIKAYDLRGKNTESLRRMLIDDGIDPNEYVSELLEICVMLHNSLTLSGMIGDTLYYYDRNKGTLEREVFTKGHPALFKYRKSRVHARKLEYTPVMYVTDIFYDIHEPSISYNISIDFNPLLRMYNDPDIGVAIEGFVTSLFELSGIESFRILNDPRTGDLASVPFSQMNLEQLSRYYSVLKAQYEKVDKYLAIMTEREKILGYNSYRYPYALKIMENSFVLDMIISYYLRFIDRWHNLSLIPEYIDIINGIREYTREIERLEAELDSLGQSIDEATRAEYISTIFKLKKERNVLIDRKLELEEHDPIRRLQFDNVGNALAKEVADTVVYDDTTIAESVGNIFKNFAKKMKR